jgi:hypothetical protein
MIARRTFVLGAAALTLVAVGCGPGSLKKGDLLETTQELRVNGESVWDDGTTEAFTRDIPPGTMFKVLFPQRPGLDIIEVIPVKVEGRENVEFVTEYFLPPHLKTRFGFKSFSITLELADIGTKVKRVVPQG